MPTEKVVNPFSPRTPLPRDQRLWFQSIKDNWPTGGTVTLAAGTSTTVSSKFITNRSVVTVFPRNTAAAEFLAGTGGWMGTGPGGLYHAYAETVEGVSFKLRSVNPAQGTEMFGYIILG